MSLKQLSNVISPATPGDAARYDNLRDHFADVPDVFAIVLLSNDGLAKCGYGLAQDEVQMIAAACSGLASLGKGLSGPVNGGQVTHTNVTLEHAHVIVTACGEGSSLVAYVKSDGAIGASIRETVRVARAFGRQMGTDNRPDTRTP
ncbi:roadblock/LC7 domain-containing protein [Streptomyces violens]|uniref:roadblock/LC7 domain-containing protein n=1 Tax=Streptomyces violens TaxID=66377 RepID=UPI0004BF7EA0|nr:roadblock/LC7 domain-containing protein [Streptomyces violens]